MELINPTSVLDVGCGTGTWLNVFGKHATITKLLGIDGDYVKGEQLVIPNEWFIPVNLNKPFDLKTKFDLVISLEVGEHLEETAANNYIESLTKHADIVLFSAAIPYQGGSGHINSQWPDYWRVKFSQRNFEVYDILRKRFWENEDINWWYRQNMFLYVKKGNYKFDFGVPEEKLLAFIHPHLFTNTVGKISHPSLKKVVKDLIKVFYSSSRKS